MQGDAAVLLSGEFKAELRRLKLLIVGGSFALVCLATAAFVLRALYIGPAIEADGQNTNTRVHNVEAVSCPSAGSGRFAVKTSRRALAAEAKRDRALQAGPGARSRSSDPLRPPLRFPGGHDADARRYADAGSGSPFIGGWDAVDFLVSRRGEAKSAEHVSTMTASGSAFCEISAVHDHFDETVVECAAGGMIGIPNCERSAAEQHASWECPLPFYTNVVGWREEIVCLWLTGAPRAKSAASDPIHPRARMRKRRLS
jgi:hypothetical protein